MATLIVLGLHGSGAGHWQRHWLAADRGARLVEQDNWAEPDLERWLDRLEETLAEGPPPTVVAHSLGAVLLVHMAVRRPWAAIADALLVAPADVATCAERHPAVASFAPVPRQRLPFPAVVVASRNDPYMTFERASGFAADWGADLEDAGAAGHLNPASGHGPWPEGFALLDRLRRMRPSAAA
jgi:hypothetical protein